MKIAYVLNTYPQPSHSFIRREINALERSGVDVVRFAMRPASVQLVDPGDQSEATKTNYILSAGAPSLAGTLLRRAIKQPASFIAALRKALQMGSRSEVGRLRHLIYLAEACDIYARCKNESITHIHAHFGTNAATVAALARALGGPPFSFTLHGPEEFDAPRALSLAEKTQSAAFSVAISQFGRSQLCRWADPSDWNRLKVVHCGIEPSAFPPPNAPPEGPLRLVSIGRFVEQKGQLILLQAMAVLHKTHPDIKLTLIGDGELRPELEAFIADNDLTGHVALTGWVDEARIRTELTNAHALVMPSFAEGLPMVIMEAMAAGRVVISTQIAGIPELVLDGKTGWLVAAGDKSTLRIAIIDAAKTPAKKLAAMGMAGRARVLERHDVDQEAAKLRSLIETAR